MAALLVSIGIMSILMSMAMPVWRHAAQREKEEELIFRGRQYARAIELFQRRYVGAFPPNLDILVEQKFLRRQYADPITGGDFQVLYLADARGGPAVQPGQPGQPGSPGTMMAPGGAQPGQMAAGPQGGIIGVVSRSTEQSIRLYQGRERYNEWQFVLIAVTQQPTAPEGQAQPGLQGPPGRMPGGLTPGGQFPPDPDPRMPPPGGVTAPIDLPPPQ